MINRSILPNNPRKPCRKLTLQIARDIWKLKSEGHLNSRIAAALDINQGRVPEVISGDRFPEARPQ